MARKPGSVIYTAMLNDRGTFESDLTAQRLSDTHYRLFVGTNAIKRDLTWLRRHADGFDVTLTDTTEDYAVLSLMGPEAARIANDVGAPELLDIGYFKQAGAHIAGKHVRAARMSYVGEAGWEITCKAENASATYAALTNAGAVPAGLFAQTSMRIEKGFCAMGHELDGDVTPVSTGLDFAVRKTGGFIGADAVAKAREGGQSHVISLVLDDVNAVPLGHEPIYHGGAIIGETSSAAFGYRIGRPVALGHVRHPVEDGTQVTLDIAGTQLKAKVILGPICDPDGDWMKPSPSSIES